MSKKLTIGLFGYGVVGTGLYDVLHKSKTVDATIKKIVVKHKDKPRNISPEHFHYDKNEILQDEEINLVVELIDDADAAFEIVKTALEKGKAVVSANKKMIAEHFEERKEIQCREYYQTLLRLRWRMEVKEHDSVQRLCQVQHLAD